MPPIAPDLDPLIGDHPSMAALRALVRRVARSKASIVLIYGETGTGKGLVARSLHAQSDRAGKGFTEINCAAIPGNLLESELFGHERGAFTGAVARKVGLLEAANGGSVFLDEIRELDPVMQAKILTLLDSRRFRRIGAVQEVSIDARFIAATNKILLAEVQGGRFRDDLYYRLQVVSINLPPLRERGDDVFVLADKFLQRYNATHGSRFTALDPDVRRIFKAYAWPGNVRELGNLLERICILEDGDTILPRHLPARIVRDAGKPLATAGAGAPAAGYAEQTRRFQRELIESALRAQGGSLARAAAALGLTRHALRHQMSKLGLDDGRARGQG
ncbi:MULTISPECIES: sigma-54 interaction domain-containing protein [Bordetella]|uniref:Fis family transcriptional regulator n=2 Tax=Bordetella TaxID=517 RepID=A0A261W1Q2_9BORD|nr:MULTISPECIES: sigma-54 dependent transcriptional regulator [Bordetella]MDM9558124.1 sigma-54 dependent transcriptional regulator [Bordetella petrii]OZI79672.1 Fis family transcriptional regulator [Bordetella genomosp. 2]